MSEDPEDQSLASSAEILRSINDKCFYDSLLLAFIYVCITLFFGILGNIFVIYVYSCARQKTTPKVFIITLAAIDLFACCFNMTTELALLRNFLMFDYTYVCKLSRFTTSFCTNVTSVVLIAMAIDRYIRICKPPKSRLHIKGAKRTIWIALFFGLVTSWPFALLYGTNTFVVYKQSNVTVTGATCLIQDNLMETDYPLVLAITLVSAHFICDVILIVLYTFIGVSVAKQLKQRRKLSQRRSAETTAINKVNDDTIELDIFVRQISTNSETFSDKLKSRFSFKKTPSRTSLRPKRHISRLRSTSSSLSFTAGENFAWKTTLMIFLVTLVFIISFLPIGIIQIVRALDNTIFASLSHRPTEFAVFNLFLRSYFLSSVLNPVVYCFLSQHFRKQVYKMFRRCFRR